MPTGWEHRRGAGNSRGYDHHRRRGGAGQVGGRGGVPEVRPLPAVAFGFGSNNSSSSHASQQRKGVAFGFYSNSSSSSLASRRHPRQCPPDCDLSTLTFPPRDDFLLTRLLKQHNKSRVDGAPGDDGVATHYHDPDPINVRSLINVLSARPDRNLPLDEAFALAYPPSPRHPANPYLTQSQTGEVRLDSPSQRFPGKIITLAHDGELVVGLDLREERRLEESLTRNPDIEALVKKVKKGRRRYV